MASDEHGALRRLVDKDEIVDLVHRYSYCVDHRLYDEVAELFTEDCVVDYGPAFAPPVRGRAALRKMFGRPGGGFAATSHHNANVLVTFEDDDRASVRASLYAWHRLADGRLRSCGAITTTWPCGVPGAGRSRRASFGCSAWRTGTSNGIGRSIRPSRSRQLR